VFHPRRTDNRVAEPAVPPAAEQVVAQWKKEYEKRARGGSELLVSAYGAYVDVKQQQVYIMLDRKVVAREDIGLLRHVVISSPAVSISSNLPLTPHWRKRTMQTSEDPIGIPDALALRRIGTLSLASSSDRSCVLHAMAPCGHMDSGLRGNDGALGQSSLALTRLQGRNGRWMVDETGLATAIDVSIVRTKT